MTYKYLTVKSCTTNANSSHSRNSVDFRICAMIPPHPLPSILPPLFLPDIPPPRYPDKDLSGNSPSSAFLVAAKSNKSSKSQKKSIATSDLDRKMRRDLSEKDAFHMWRAGDGNQSQNRLALWPHPGPLRYTTIRLMPKICVLYRQKRATSACHTADRSRRIG